MKAKPKRSHKPIDWLTIQKMAEARKSNGEAKYSMADIAKATKYDNPQSADRFQELRGIISRGKTVGFSHPKTGKLVRIKPADRPRGRAASAVNGTAKAAKKPQVAAKSPKVAAKKKAVAKGKAAVPKAVLIVLHGSKKFLRVEAPKVKNLVKVEDALPQMTEALDALGFAVVKKATLTDTTETADQTTGDQTENSNVAA